MTDESPNNEGNKVNPGHFGPGVIGKELHATEQAIVERQADVFGPGVVGLPTGPVNKVGPGVTDQTADGPKLVKDDAAEAVSLSIRELEEALEKNPALVDTFLPVELARAAGPRKGAIAALEIAEQLREGGPREEVVAQIAAAFEPPAGGSLASEVVEEGDPDEG